MKSISRLGVALALLLAFVERATAAVEAPTPLLHAHAHNDYEHTRPLLDALDQGFCSVEADIYLVNGQLLVAHDRDQVKPERTLQALYLDPLRARIRANDGRVYHRGPPVVLLIDVKSEGGPTYLALRDVLKEYADVLTRFSREGIQTNALIAIISGNRAPELLAEEAIRYAAIDGRPEDLKGNSPKELIPLVSEDWKRLFNWRGSGSFPAEQKERLVKFVAEAHQQGRWVRFWGTPDEPALWRELLDAGVDLLNADDLAGLGRFLRAR